MAGQKTLLSLLIVVFSIVCTQGKPAEEISNDNFSKGLESSNDEYKPKDQLLVYTYDMFKDISYRYVDQAQNISKHILKDDTLLGRSSSVEVEGFKKNLTNFMEQYNKSRQPEEYFQLVDIFAAATEFYMELPNEAITPDTAVIIATLKKYGSDKLEENTDKLLHEFVKKFKQKFEEKKEFLQEEPAILNWYEQFKTLTILEDQMDAFETLLKLY